MPQDSNNDATWRDYLNLHFYVLLMGFTAILGDLISLSAASLVSWRTGLAGIALFTWVFLSPGKSAKIALKPALGMIATGLVLGLHWLCFYGSIKLANVSICLTGMASISLFTAIIEPIITKRPFRREELWVGLIVIAGLSLVLSFAFDHWLGFLVSVLGALLAAIFPSYTRLYVQRGYSAIVITAYEMIGATIVCLVAALLWGDKLIPTAADWLWIAILSGVCTVYAFALFVHLLRRMTAYTTALALNFEPVYGILLAAWLLNEHEELDIRFYFGTFILVLASFIHTRLVARQRRKLLANTAG